MAVKCVVCACFVVWSGLVCFAFGLLCVPPTQQRDQHDNTKQDRTKRNEQQWGGGRAHLGQLRPCRMGEWVGATTIGLGERLKDETVILLRQMFAAMIHENEGAGSSATRREGSNYYNTYFDAT